MLSNSQTYFWSAKSLSLKLNVDRLNHSLPLSQNYCWSAKSLWAYLTKITWHERIWRRLLGMSVSDEDYLAWAYLTKTTWYLTKITWHKKSTRWWWPVLGRSRRRLFQKRVVHTKFDIYVVIVTTVSIPLMVDSYKCSSRWYPIIPDTVSLYLFIPYNNMEYY